MDVAAIDTPTAKAASKEADIEVSRALRRAVMLVVIVTGVGSSLLKRAMEGLRAPTGWHDPVASFDHPVLWSELMSLGMACCLPLDIWLSRPRSPKAQPEEGAPVARRAKAPMRLYVVSAICDFMSVLLMNRAYHTLPASVIDATNGLQLVFTCVLSTAVQRCVQHRCHIAGILLVLLGFSLVVLCALLTPEAPAGEEAHWRSTCIAFGFCVGSQLFCSFLYVYSDRYMKQYEVRPLELVAKQGLIMVPCGIIAMIVANACSWEDTRASFYQLAHSVPLVLCVLGLLLDYAMFKYAVKWVIKHDSGVTGSMLGLVKTVLTWVVEVVFRLNTFRLLQLVGLLTLTAGMCIYKRVLVVRALEPPAKELLPVHTSPQKAA